MSDQIKPVIIAAMLITMVTVSASYLPPAPSFRTLYHTSRGAVTPSQDRRQHGGPGRTDPLSKDTGQQGTDLNSDLSVSRVQVLPASPCYTSTEREVSMHHRGIEKEGHWPGTSFKSLSGLLGGRGAATQRMTNARQPGKHPLRSDLGRSWILRGEG